MVSPDGNFKTYREIIPTKEPPVNPYLALSLRDLSLIEMHNETYLASSDDINPVINFDKLRLVYPILSFIQNLQKVGYSIEVHPGIQTYLDNLKVLTEKQLWAVSKAQEPYEQRETRSPTIL